MYDPAEVELPPSFFSSTRDVIARFREISSLPVAAIIYTHGHRDHISGTSVFCAGGSPEIIARGNIEPDLYRDPDRYAPTAIMLRRTARQFGMGLRQDTERINLGLGPGDRPTEGLGAGFMAPTRTFDEDRLKLTLCGVDLELRAAAGRDRRPSRGLGRRPPGALLGGQFLPLLPQRANRLAQLAGGADVLMAKARAALDDGDCQWAMELCDLLLDLGEHVEQARAVKADALTAAAERQINATARNYYLVYARELREGRIQPIDRDRPARPPACRPGAIRTAGPRTART